MPWKKFSLFILVVALLGSVQLVAQVTLSGKIMDENGEPLPFATVYQEGTTNGTTSNAEGLYTLNFPPGEYVVVAQYTGYERSTKTVNITASKQNKLDFYLNTETLVLKEVIISASDEDPARQIIRNAIRKRKYYANEVAAFACEVYVKGLQRLDEKPSSILGVSITADTGIVYLSESISRLKFMQPDKINETMISSKVSGENNAFSYNQASEMLINLYENSFFIEGLSEQSFISPIANNAFLYYDYKLAGTIIENDLFINKIRVIPKRKTDPVFSGYIYIIEDSWRIHSVDVKLKKSNGIEFLDELTFNQVFAPVDYGIWMPISQRFTFDFKAFGFKGSGHFTAIYRNYKVEPAYYIPRNQPEKEQAPLPEKKERKRRKHKDEDKGNKLFTEKDFTKAVLTVEDDANEKDSMYWAEVRPIPLTQIEIKDYQVKDSIKLVKESKPYKDSIDDIRNKFKIGNIFFNGYTHFNSYKKKSLQFPTLLQGIQYNSVEGLVANMEFSYASRNEHTVDYRIIPSFRYGFGNNRLQAKVEALKLIALKKREFLMGGFGRYVYQFNNADPILPFYNSMYTLIGGINYIRLYEQSFANVGYQREIVNGLLFTGRIAYASRSMMDNNASYNFQDREFEPNIPVNQEDTTWFPSHQALTLAARFKIRLGQPYIDRPDRKINLQSKFPDLYVVYKAGFPILGSDVDYHLIKLGLDYRVRLGLFGESHLSTWTGAYLGDKSLYFPDYEHFNGNEIVLRRPGGENLFQLLPYYDYSTKDRFAQAHYEHHFNEFIFNKIPFIKYLNLQAVASINYLTTPTLGHYFEFGAGIEHIFKIMRVDYFTSIRNGNYESSGIRVGLGF